MHYGYLKILLSRQAWFVQRTCITVVLPAEAAAAAADAARPAAPLAATAEAFALTAGAALTCDRVRFACAVPTCAQEGEVKTIV